MPTFLDILLEAACTKHHTSQVHRLSGEIGSLTGPVGMAGKAISKAMNPQFFGEGAARRIAKQLALTVSQA
jgi:hypothetical protein